MKALLKSTFNIVAAVVVLFALIAIVVAKNTSALMVFEAERTVRSVVKNTTGQIDRLMTGVEAAVANQKWIISEHLDDPEYMYRVTRELVENNEYIVGSTVAFRPGFFKSKGRLYSPYSCRPVGGGKVECFTLPYEYPEYDWYKVASETGKPRWSEPYYDEGGGDLYDFVRKGGRLYFIIGDASGKGVPAALFSFMVCTVFRMACDMGLDAGEIVGRINQTLVRNNEMSMFVTAFVGVLDLGTGELEFGCAGHMAISC